MESGQLPSGRYGVRAAMVDNVVYVSGGYDGDKYFTSILSWDPTSESWQLAGDLAAARIHHAALAVPSSILKPWCSGMLST